APDGSLYVAGADDSDEDYSGVHRLGPVLPGDAWSTTLIASDEGAEVYQFEEGRHTATLSALTGATLYRFGYDGDGRLVTVTDADGNVTTVERDGAGNPTAIVAPGGQRTELTLDANGFLASVANPAAETWQFAYSADGLLQTSTDPNGGISTYSYDGEGRLVENVDPAGGGQTLAKSEIEAGHQVTRTTAGGTVYTYASQWFDDEILLTNEGCCGPESTSLAPDGTRTLHLVDGSTVTVSTGKDRNRFGGQAPYVDHLRLDTPGGHAFEMRRLVYSYLADDSDPFSMTERTDNLQLPTASGSWGTFSRRYDASTGEETLTTPEGRTAVTTYDSRGRVVRRQLGSLAPVATTYDAAGRVASVTAGEGADARTYAFTYH
ncbi:MAG: RHS repeat protein, partial [Candidatus Dadabacteria bacterium]